MSIGQEKCVAAESREAVFRAAPEAPINNWARPRPGRATKKR